MYRAGTSDYLCGLKHLKIEELALKGITESFDNVMNKLKQDEYYDPTGLGETVDYLSISGLIDKLRQDRREIYGKYDKSDNGIFVKEEVLGKLFKGLTLSSKVIEHRMSTRSTLVSRIQASRRELLMYAFFGIAKNMAVLKMPAQILKIVIQTSMSM